MNKQKMNTKQLVLCALGMAIVFIATMYLKIPNGIQGYFNLGDGFIMVFASILNPFYAFMVGGIGSGLADVAGGYGIYFLPTLLIKGFEAVLIAYSFHHIKNKWKYVSYVLGATLMASGYFLCDSLLNESWVLGASGILANILQGGIGVVIALLTQPMLKRAIHTQNKQ